jgi:hypothetical protein
MLLFPSHKVTFTLLHRYYVLRHSLPNLKDVGLTCFRGRCFCASCELAGMPVHLLLRMT